MRLVPADIGAVGGGGGGIFMLSSSLLRLFFEALNWAVARLTNNKIEYFKVDLNIK